MGGSSPSSGTATSRRSRRSSAATARPLRSYAASIVTAQRADDVTQEAFTKAYLALRGTDKEIQLRPWLYRIVRNTALTNIRDEPKPGLELDEARAAGMSPEELAEQREEVERLMAGLRELPEPQRAAIVMRELEGLSHEQIAASLGLSGGAVRQSIYRARRALRDAAGMLVPMPLLRQLLEEGFTQGASAAAAGGGAGIAVKTGVAALLAAGTLTTGRRHQPRAEVAVEGGRDTHQDEGRRGGWRPHPRGHLAQRRGGLHGPVGRRWRQRPRRRPGRLGRRHLGSPGLKQRAGKRALGHRVEQFRVRRLALRVRVRVGSDPSRANRDRVAQDRANPSRAAPGRAAQAPAALARAATGRVDPGRAATARAAPGRVLRAATGTGGPTTHPSSATRTDGQARVIFVAHSS